MRFVAITGKAFKERIRNRNVLAMQLLFPAVFMLVFGVAFTQGGFDRNQPYEIAVVDEDAGTRIGQERVEFGEQLVGILEEATYENDTAHMFTLRNASRDEAIDLLKGRKVTCAVVIPESFSLSIESLINTTTRTALASAIGEGLIPPDSGIVLPPRGEVDSEVLIQGDPSFMAFGAAQSMLVTILNQYVESIEAEAVSSVWEEVPSAPPVSEVPQYVAVGIESIAGTEESSNFDYFAPGIIVFGLLLGSIATAEALAREIETNTLSRLKVSLMSSFDLLFGSLLAWALLAVIQVLILFGVALALGFNWVGGMTSLVLAILVGCVVGIACIALGMLVAAFARGQEHASSLGTLVAVPMSFVIGVFIGFPPGTFTQIIAVLPWRQGLLSLLGVLTYGSTLEEVAPNIVALVVETAVLFAIGVVAFSRLKLRPS